MSAATPHGGTAVPADQFGEQTYIKQGKGQGGLKGISVAVWINSHPICSHLSKIVEEMYTSEETAENSEEEDGKAKQSRRKH